MTDQQARQIIEKLDSIETTMGTVKAIIDRMEQHDDRITKLENQQRSNSTILSFIGGAVIILGIETAVVLALRFLG